MASLSCDTWLQKINTGKVYSPVHSSLYYWVLLICLAIIQNQWKYTLQSVAVVEGLGWCIFARGKWLNSGRACFGGTGTRGKGRNRGLMNFLQVNNTILKKILKLWLLLMSLQLNFQIFWSVKMDHLLWKLNKTETGSQRFTGKWFKERLIITLKIFFNEVYISRLFSHCFHVPLMKYKIPRALFFLTLLIESGYVLGHNYFICMNDKKVR